MQPCQNGCMTLHKTPFWLYNEVMQPNDVVNIGVPSLSLGPSLTSLLSFHTWGPFVISWAKDIVGILIGLSFPVSVFFIIVIVYSVERLKILRKKESAIYEAKVEEAFEDVQGQGESENTRRWDDVVKHISSPNENDWKQAINDADIMLDQLLGTMGYRGLGVGEKLKRVEPGDFKSVQDAWKAHLVRNRIAHEPGFVLTQSQAQETYLLYKKVFDEFYYV